MTRWLLLTSAGAACPCAGGRPSLAAMQAAVGGYVERVHLEHGMALWVNEDGLALGLAPNALASTVCSVFRPVTPRMVIVGDALLECGRTR